VYVRTRQRVEDCSAAGDESILKREVDAALGADAYARPKPGADVALELESALWVDDDAVVGDVEGAGLDVGAPPRFVALDALDAALAAAAPRMARGETAEVTATQAALGVARDDTAVAVYRATLAEFRDVARPARKYRVKPSRPARRSRSSSRRPIRRSRRQNS